MRLSVFLTYFFFLFFYYPGQSQFYPAKVYSIEDNIPGYAVFDITQTPDQIMWFLSSKGVFSYNSIDWQLQHDTLNLPSTAFSFIKTHEDGSLWVAGQNNTEFVVKYLKDDTWNNVAIPPELKLIKEAFAFNIIKRAEEYHALIGWYDHLYDVNVANGSFSKVKHPSPEFRINEIQPIGDSICVSTNSGIFIYSQNKLVGSAVNNHFGKDQVVLKLLESGDQVYVLSTGWMGSWKNNKLDYLSKNNGLSKPSIYNKHNLDLDSQNRIYFSSQSVPAYLDPEFKTINQLLIKEVDFNYLSSRMFVDFEENVWVGDHRGLFKFNMSSFQNYNSNSGLIQNEVSVIFEHGDQLLIACPNSLHTLKNGKVVNQVVLSAKPGFRFLDIAESEDGSVFLAAQYGGLYQYRNGTLTNLKHLVPGENGISSVELFKNEIYLSGTTGIFKLQKGRSEKVVSVFKLRNLKTVSPDTLAAFTYRNGVMLYHKGDTTWFKADNNKYNSVYSMIHWSDQWILATGNGLATFEGKKIVPFHFTDKLKNVGVYSLLEDEQGNLWIGTNEGVHVWDGKTLSSYNKREGLSGAEVNRNAMIQDRNANLWIGTESGVSMLAAANIKPPFVTKKVLTFQGRSDSKKLDSDGTTVLNHNDNNLNFDFIWPSYRSENSTSYRYRLVGLSDEWTETHPFNTVEILNLPSGEFEFQVQAHLSGVTWSSIESLRFKVSEPFYATTWFIALGSVLVFLVFYGFYRVRFYYFLKRQAKLKRLVSKRTESLAQKNSEIEQQNAVLQQQSEEIININKKLEETIKDLRNTQKFLVQTEKMASLGTISAGIGHEINNPLNFIKGGITILEKELARDADDMQREFIDNAIDLIDDGISRVSNIVSSLNQFSRTSTLKDVCDVQEVIENCLTILQGSISEKIKIQRSYCSDKIMIEANVGNFHQVIMNVLSNAQQAIHESGTIEIITENLQDSIRIIVKDDGPGLSQDEAAKVFDPFFTTKPPGHGTGLGLSIAYTIVKEHEGSIEFSSSPGQGATVIIQIPQYLNRQTG